MLDIKPSQKPIKEYLQELDSYTKHRRVNEKTLCNKYHDVLQIFIKKLGWQFIEGYRINRTGRCDVLVGVASIMWHMHAYLLGIQFPDPCSSFLEVEI